MEDLKQVSNATSADKTVINYKDLMHALDYIRYVNSLNLRDVCYIDKNGVQLQFEEQMIKEWEYIGLNNKDFFDMEYWNHQCYIDTTTT